MNIAHAARWEKVYGYITTQGMPRFQGTQSNFSFLMAKRGERMTASFYENRSGGSDIAGSRVRDNHYFDIFCPI